MLIVHSTREVCPFYYNTVAVANPCQDALSLPQANKIGVQYDTDENNLTLGFPLSPARRMTERQLVSAIHEVYVSLGFGASLLPNETMRELNHSPSANRLLRPTKTVRSIVVSKITSNATSEAFIDLKR